jgi:hypothetical protein
VTCCRAKGTICKQFSDAHTSTFAQATAAKIVFLGQADGGGWED